ncbi:MAG TPA: hypothetical protein VGM39_07730 [Kofleriaceae bacterium]|jgi:hypothetical protein
MNDERQNLREKLCRELAQAERDAVIHTERECTRLGDVPPAARMRAISANAKHLQPRLAKLVSAKQPIGFMLGRAVGDVFSATRHYFVDRILSTERSYRATLLGLKHGLDAARLLREVARVDVDVQLAEFCDDLIAQREKLIAAAEHELAWFATHSAFAMASGARAAAAATW